MTDYTYGYDDQTDAFLLAKCQKGWRSEETPCGSGSEKANAIHAYMALEMVIKDYAIESINDAGAGDLNWIRTTGFEYAAFDLVPRHACVQKFDITKQVMPQADLILCRHVLNHLSIKQAQDALDRFKESGSHLLLMTNCDNQRNYWKHYHFNPLPEPLAVYNDCQHWQLELYTL